MQFTCDDPIMALEASGVLMRRDDFSVQYTHPLDAKFWIRIELPVQRPYHVTDLFWGYMTDGQLSLILYHAILILSGKIDGDYRFSNICPQDSSKADQDATRILQILEMVAAYGAKLVTSSEVKEQGGKYELRATVF